MTSVEPLSANQSNITTLELKSISNRKSEDFEGVSNKKSEDFEELKSNEELAPPFREASPPPAAIYMPQRKPKGYDMLAEIGKKYPLPPPRAPTTMQQDKPQKVYFGAAEPIGEYTCQEALKKWVNQQTFYGKSMAQNNKITSIKPSHEVYYTLETFLEYREVCFKVEPYGGHPVEDSGVGVVAPKPWEVECPPRETFKTHVRFVDVPHTVSYKECHVCGGSRFKHCENCQGLGHQVCSTCNGGGLATVPADDGGSEEVMEDCTDCEGGEEMCGHCEGQGRIKCHLCNGFGLLKCFIQLIVKFENQEEVATMELTGIHDAIAKDLPRVQVFESVRAQVLPITNFPVPQLNEKFQVILENHLQNWPDGKIIKQRQRIKCAQVTKVQCTWLDHQYTYWVYGPDNKVYFPDYPQSTCFGCDVI